VPGSDATPQFTDQVVLLTGHRPADVQRHLDGEDAETARRFGWWPGRSTEQTVVAAYQLWAAQWRSGGPTRAFATRQAETGLLVGGCELRIQPDGSGQVSYWTHAGERRQGYATRALRLLCAYAASIGVTRLEAHVAPDNQASRRVAEGAGFTPLDVFSDDKGELMMRYVWAAGPSATRGEPR
jgi:RimJ/RimL family protein N-acetyltransferase